MTNRTTIYLGEPLKRLLEAAGSENRSGRINTMAECYEEIIADELQHGVGRLSTGEWCAIVDANNPGWGVFAGNGQVDAQLAWANVADMDEDLGKKWAIDRDALVAKMRAMRPAARIAVYEVVSRFWGHPDLNGLSTTDLLQKAGAIFADAPGVEA